MKATSIATIGFALIAPVALAQTPPPLVTQEQADDAYAQEQQAQSQQMQQGQPPPPQDAYSNPSPQQQNWNNDPIVNGGASGTGYADQPTIQPNEAPTVSSVQEFDQSLSPYGDWVIVNGTRVWRPSQQYVGSNFVPYSSNGQWQWTDAGWVFASTLPFGWATYHYGRWWNDPSYGWVWWPDTTWGPSWVDWRWGGGYAGWAPLAPIGWGGSWWRPSWYFVNSRYMCSPYLYRYAVPSARYGQVFAATTVIAPRAYGNVRWNVGPSYANVAGVSYAPPVRRSYASFAPPTSVRVVNNFRPSQTYVAPTASPVYRGGNMAPGAAPVYRGSAPTQRFDNFNQGYRGPSSAPVYRGSSPSMPSSPMMRAPSSMPSAPMYRGGGGAPPSSAPVFRGGGGGGPSMHSAPMSAPVFRGGGGGGGHHR